MVIDLDKLGQMHPALQRAEEVELYRRRGALALRRCGHAPGVTARVLNGAARSDATISWSSELDPEATLAVIDDQRLTEDGAEAIALAFVHGLSGWTVRRRVQREGSADWLLEDKPRKRKMALEVSGTISDNAEGRLRIKLAQVGRVSEKGCVRAAVVVRFEEPRVLASTVEEEAIP